MNNEVWIPGGTARSARVITTELMARGLTPVLVGRHPTRLAEAAHQAAQAIAANPTEATFDINIRPRTVVAASIDDMAAATRRDRPPVVINTVGPFATTAAPIARACLAAGSHYIDLANDVAAVTTVLGLDQAAQEAGRTLITGAGFCVTATESVVVKLIQDQPPTAPAPENVRVDMIPSLAVEAGPPGGGLVAGAALGGRGAVDPRGGA